MQGPLLPHDKFLSLDTVSHGARRLKWRGLKGGLSIPVACLLAAGALQASANPPANGLALSLDAGAITNVRDGLPLTSGWMDPAVSGAVFSSPNPPTFIQDSGGGFPALRFDGAGQYLEAAFDTGPEATVFVLYANRRDPLLAGYSETLLATGGGSGADADVQLASTRLIDEGPIIQFGWARDSLSSPAYQSQVGAGAIVQWNGLDATGGNSGTNGSINNEPVGATLTAAPSGLTLTSEVISSSDPLVSHTRQSGSQLGISVPSGNTAFRESLESSWSFSFDQEVRLKRMLMSSFNNPNDTAQISIAGGGTYEVTVANTDPTDAWEDRSHLNLRVFNFPTPVTLAPGTQVTVSAEGANNPNLNIFLVGGIVVAQAPTPPDYPGFVATGAGSGPSDSWVNGLDTTHAGTDILPGRYYLGTASYDSLPGSSSLVIGARSATASFGRNDIREILVYDSVLSDAERFAVQAYFEDKYGIEMANNPPDHPLETINHILGAQQIGQQYNFGESGFQVLDAARAVYRQGANVFKLSLSNRYAEQNGVPIDPEIDSLTELVRDQPAIRAVFDMPFKDILFWASSFSVPNLMAKATPNGLRVSDQQLIYDEIYDLTVHLLETYDGTGRRFYVGNWEGDWVLGTLGSQSPETTITPGRINTMVDWARIRQQAVDDAKTDTPHNDVEVWYYLEMNKGDWTINNRPSVVNSVMPQLSKLDMVSYSAYTSKNAGRASTHAVLDKIHDALPPIDPSLPDYLKPTGSRLMIGEYGYFQGPNDVYTQTYQYVDEINNFLSWGPGPPRFILMWEFFWEEDANNGLPKNMHMINSNNELHPLYHLHESYYRHMQQWVEDYVATNGSFPDTAAYRDEAMAKISDFDPWPFTVRLDPANVNTLQIPSAVDAVLTESYTALVENGFGGVVSGQAVTWDLQPAHGATIDSSTGVLSLPGNASPGNYAVSATLASNSSVSDSKAVQFVLPVASIYDSLVDVSKLSTSNPALEIVGDNAAVRFEGDDSRLRRIGSTDPQPVTWNVAGLNRFYAKVYYFNQLGLSAEVSADGISWQPIALRTDPGTVTDGSWERAWVAPASPLPAGTNYLRLILEDAIHSYTPQIGEVAIFGDATGYDFWKQENFPNSADQADPAISGPEAQADGLGVSNLFRYLTDMGLSDTDYTLMPEIRVNGGELVYAVPFDATKSDVRVRVLASHDLQSWPYTVFDSFTNTAVTEDGWLLIDFDAVPAADAKFMRVVWDILD